MKLLVRADGNASLGTGHTTRCLALADRWAKHGEAVLATRDSDEAVRSQWVRRGHRVIDADLELMRRERPDAVVVDGYHLGTDERRTLAALAPTLLVDDHGRSAWPDAPAVLDGNLDPGTYDAPALLGPRYALLRPGFAPVPLAHRCGTLITFGGNAPPGLVAAVVMAVADVRGAAYDPDDPDAGPTTLILGAVQEDADGLRAYAEAHGVHVEQAVEDMASRMNQHARAVAAAGTTVLELAASGLPALLVPLADNQRPVAAAATRLGIARSAPPDDPDALRGAVHAFLAAPSDELRAMAAAGPRLVDGRGARRVCAWLRARCVQVRDATDADRDRILAWNNDPGMRQVSYSPDPITPEAHATWWRARMQDTHSHLLVGELDGPLGFVRLVRREHEAVLSVNVAPERRGQGLGAALVGAATQWFQRRHPLPVVAAVRHLNPVSRAVFLDADYDPAPDRAEFPDAWVLVRPPPQVGA